MDTIFINTKRVYFCTVHFKDLIAFYFISLKYSKWISLNINLYQHIHNFKIAPDLIFQCIHVGFL